MNSRALFDREACSTCRIQCRPCYLPKRIRNHPTCISRNIQSCSKRTDVYFHIDLKPGSISLLNHTLQSITRAVFVGVVEESNKVADVSIACPCQYNKSSIPMSPVRRQWTPVCIPIVNTLQAKYSSAAPTLDRGLSQRRIPPAASQPYHLQIPA